MHTITETVQAPTGIRYAPTAFNNVIGVAVPMNDYPGHTAILTQALVGHDGTDVTVTFELDDATWEAMALRGLHAAWDKLNITIHPRPDTTQGQD